LSPYFKLENKNLVGKYWESADYKDLSYRRGLTIAFALDTRIQDDGRGSLDELLRALYKKSKPQLTFSKSLFDQLVTTYADTSMLAAIDSANNGANTLLTNILAHSVHYKFQMVAVNKIFDLGFDYASSRQAKKIVGLKAGSNAEKAGLAENMEITNRFSIWTNDTEKPAKVEVIKDGKKVWLQYIPSAEVKLYVPQVSG
jgi:predicted metalloprotease with PDZ domain